MYQDEPMAPGSGAEGHAAETLEDLDGIGPRRTVGWAPFLGEAATAELRDVPSEELVSRRRAVRDLGRSIRALADASVMTEVPPESLADVTRLVNEAAHALGVSLRQSRTASTVDDVFNGVRMFSPMSGEGNPFIAPLSFRTEGGVSSATCRFGEAFVGPPNHVHGGVSAMVMDQVLGHVVADAETPGLTRKLAVQYLRPVPADVDLIVSGRVVATGGSDVFAQASIAASAAPDVKLVTADGHFRVLRPEQAASFLTRLA